LISPEWTAFTWVPRSETIGQFLDEGVNHDKKGIFSAYQRMLELAADIMLPAQAE
jgi:hypothetical protein